jgi:hypothetical protein
VPFLLISLLAVPSAAHQTLWDAAAAQDAALVSAVLADGADVNQRFAQGRTALFLAAEKNALAVMQLLLDRDALIDARDDEGLTPLFVAARACRVESLALLLKRHANPDVRVRHHGETPLMAAAAGSCLDGVVLLLDAGADARAVDETGKDALMVAASTGQLSEMLRRLIEHGGDPKARDQAGHGALFYARAAGYGDRLGPLLERAGGQTTSDDERGLKERVRAPFYAQWPLQSCRMYQLGTGPTVELCAISEPAPASAAGRRFAVELRNPSALEKGVKPLQAKHAWIAGVEVEASDEEYLLYESVEWYALSGGTDLLFVPIVHGVPADWDAARATVFLFDERSGKLRQAWTAPRCPRGCTRQTIQLQHKPPDPHYTIRYLQTVGGQTHAITLSWDGKRLAELR